MSDLIFQSNGTLHIDHDVFELYIEEAKIVAHIREVAVAIINLDLYNPIIMGVLQGGVYFQNLLEQYLFIMGLDFESDNIGIRSYGKSEKSSGEVEFYKEPDLDLEDRDVLIIEDIVETGLSLSSLHRRFQSQGLKSLRFISLLKKKTTLTVNNFELFGPVIEIDDVWVIGCGLDHKEIAEVRKLKDLYKKIE